jgi:Ca2+-binding RTX toxin-like protein
MPRRILLAAAVLVAAVAAPSAAQAATIYQDGRTPHRLLVYAEPGESNLVSVEGSNSVVITDDGTPLKVDGVPTCMPLDAHTVSCSAVRRVELELGNGPDVAVIATPHEVSLDAGIGQDRYVALATDAPSRVDFEGGPGIDVANYFYATEGVRVTTDGTVGSGRPGDLDRVRRSVETVFGSQYDDVLHGGPRDAQSLLGFDGDDQITGGPGQDVLSGGGGNDRIDALDGELDSIDCGGGLLEVLLADAAEASIAGCG